MCGIKWGCESGSVCRSQLPFLVPGSPPPLAGGRPRVRRGLLGHEGKLQWLCTELVVDRALPGKERQNARIPCFSKATFLLFILASRRVPGHHFGPHRGLSSFQRALWSPDKRLRQDITTLAENKCRLNFPTECLTLQAIEYQNANSIIAACQVEEQGQQLFVLCGQGQPACGDNPCGCPGFTGKIT